ncbi:hypothetical protein NC651_030822 [Populus alba x Populus x berolinensis]|nr:hypothetical protein NC651_030822 [Populus alba x Populus x berolinensis]
MASQEAEALFKSDFELLQLSLAFVDTMALKCAVELKLADIINSHGRPISLSQIASGCINSPSTDISYLARIMRYLVRKDIFTAHPPSDGGETLFRILHDWSDESCVEILRNCKKAIPEKTGKLIIADIVLQTDDHCHQLDDVRMAMDLAMFAVTTGGKERTEQEWKKLLEDGGFARYKIIKIPALESIIEAYPE